MRILFQSFAVMAVVLLAVEVSHADEAAEKHAVLAAEQWLKIVDAEQYGQSWEIASPFVKNMVQKDQWSKSVSGARKPFGALVSRSLKSQQYATTLPGAPDGEYVVIQYSASFQNKKSAIETVTPKRDTDGSWRVAGYYIR